MINIFIDVGLEKTISFITKQEKEEHKIISHTITKSSNFQDFNHKVNLKNSISNNLNEIKKQTKTHWIQNTFISVPSTYVNKRYESFQIDILSNSQVSYIDIDRLITRAASHLNEKNKHIIHIIPIEYSLNGEDNIYNPIGKQGNILHAKLLILEIDLTYYSEMQSILKEFNLNITRVYLDSLAASYAVLSEYEKDNGAIMIDFSASKTCIMFFHKKSMLHFKTLNIGFSVILDKIMQEFDLSKSEAIRVRNLYVMDHNQIYKNSNISNNLGKTIKLDIISKIIHDRVNEIIEETTKYVNNIELTDLCKDNIILTGGASIMPYLKKIINESIGPCRVSELKQFSNIIQDNSNPGSYATVLGMIEAENDRIKATKLISIKDKMKVLLKKFIKWLNT